MAAAPRRQVAVAEIAVDGLNAQSAVLARVRLTVGQRTARCQHNKHARTDSQTNITHLHGPFT